MNGHSSSISRVAQGWRGSTCSGPGPNINSEANRDMSFAANAGLRVALVGLSATDAFDRCAYGVDGRYLYRHVVSTPDRG